MLERNELDMAAHYIEEGLAYGRGAGIWAVLDHGGAALARVWWARGDVDGARAALEEQERRHMYGPDGWWKARTAAWRAWLDVVCGDIQAAARWASTLAPRTGPEPEYVSEQEKRTLALVLIAQGQAREALPIIAWELRAAEASVRGGQVLEILVLQALALEASGDHDRAEVVLARALALGEPEGFVRTFVDVGAPLAAIHSRVSARGVAPGYVQRLLLAFRDAEGRALSAESSGTEYPTPPGSHPTRHVALMEPLSTREREVLRLLAAGLSNREIGERLVIAEGTAKKHVHAIYGKLDARNRTQAVARASTGAAGLGRC